MLNVQKLNFIIQGNNVQEHGYRLFLFQLMKRIGVKGYPTNLAGGKYIQVIVWGNKKQLLDFYKNAELDKPKSVGEIDLTQPIFSKEPMPERVDLLDEKMDLMIEQTGKFVDYGKKITGQLKTLPKNTAKELGKVINH